MHKFLPISTLSEQIFEKMCHIREFKELKGNLRHINLYDWFHEKYVKFVSKIIH